LLPKSSQFCSKVKFKIIPVLLKSKIQNHPSFVQQQNSHSPFGHTRLEEIQYFVSLGFFFQNNKNHNQIIGIDHGLDWL
jgi:hypothetical protein